MSKSGCQLWTLPVLQELKTWAGKECLILAMDSLSLRLYSKWIESQARLQPLLGHHIAIGQSVSPFEIFWDAVTSFCDRPMPPLRWHVLCLGPLRQHVGWLNPAISHWLPSSKADRWTSTVWGDGTPNISANCQHGARSGHYCYDDSWLILPSIICRSFNHTGAHLYLDVDLITNFKV